MKGERRKFRIALLFAFLFATLTFVTVGCASGTTPPEEAWNKTFGGTYTDQAWSVQQTEDGGYILVGETFSYGACIWLVKTDSNGNEQWNKTFGGTRGAGAKSVQQTEDGGYILAGCTRSYGVGYDDDFWLVKTDSNGNEQWNKTFGGNSYDKAWSVQQTEDGGFVLVGNTGRDDVWLVKTDSDGNEQWNKTFGGTGYDMAYSVQQTEGGGYILAGGTSSYGAGSVDFWLVKTDSDGNEQWNRTFGGTNEDRAHTLQQTSDGGYILAGYTMSFGAGGHDFWLVKTDSDGNDQWNRTLGDTDYDAAWSVQQTSDGGYILAGVTKSYGAGSGDVWLVKTNSNGNEQWNRTFGGTGYDRANSVQQTSDGGYILAGSTDSYGAGSYDFWLVKVGGEPTPTLTPTAASALTPVVTSIPTPTLEGIEERETHIITLDSGYLFPTCFPSLSPDWEKVAFSTYEDLGDGSVKLTLLVINMDGTGMKKLDERIDDSQSFDMIVGWSPDGKYILNWQVYWIFGEMAGELWIVSSDGADKKKLVEGISPSDVIWSPDGDKFAYTEVYYTTKFSDNASHTETTKNFYVVDINKNTNTLITDGTPLLWTTDDEIIYYKKEFTGKGDDVHYTTWKMDLNRAIPTKLGSINTPPYAVPDAISPDESKIAYGDDSGIWVVNIDGSDLKQLTVSDELSHSNPKWSPDGKRIAFLSWMGRGIQVGIWVINFDGCDHKKLTSVVPTYGWGLWGQVWNKDSSKIAYAKDDFVNLTNDIYILDAGEPPSITPTTGVTPTEEEPGFEAITPEPSLTPTPTPEEGVPGFEVVFAIAGLLAVAYLLRRRK